MPCLRHITQALIPKLRFPAPHACVPSHLPEMDVLGRRVLDLEAHALHARRAAIRGAELALGRVLQGRDEQLGGLAEAHARGQHERGAQQHQHDGHAEHGHGQLGGARVEAEAPHLAARVGPQARMDRVVGRVGERVAARVGGGEGHKGRGLQLRVLDDALPQDLVGVELREVLAAREPFLQVRHGQLQLTRRDARVGHVGAVAHAPGREVPARVQGERRDGVGAREGVDLDEAPRGRRRRHVGRVRGEAERVVALAHEHRRRVVGQRVLDHEAVGALLAEVLRQHRRVGVREQGVVVAVLAARGRAVGQAGREVWAGVKVVRNPRRLVGEEGAGDDGLVEVVGVEAGLDGRRVVADGEVRDGVGLVPARADAEALGIRLQLCLVHEAVLITADRFVPGEPCDGHVRADVAPTVSDDGPLALQLQLQRVVPLPKLRGGIGGGVEEALDILG